MHWNHIVFHPPSCQDKPTLPSSVNTWDGLLLPTQPRGSCWCACCCQLMCHWKKVLLFHWETNCIGRRVKAEATCLARAEEEVHLFNWDWETETMPSWWKWRRNGMVLAQQQWRRLRNKSKDTSAMTVMATSQLSMCSNSFFIYVLYGWGKQFEVAVSLNLDVMTSFWIHKWPRTPTSSQEQQIDLAN